jgi:superfamily II DNA/RNA helicase
MEFQPLPIAQDANLDQDLAGRFCSLSIHDSIKWALRDMGFDKMMPVQENCIPVCGMMS